MPQKGQILKDTVTGNIYEFIETAEDTHGAKVTVKITLNDKGKIAPDHIHLNQDETFEIFQGTMTYTLNGKEHEIKAGESIMLQRNVPHNHYNLSDEPLVFLQTIEPAYDIDYFFETLVGLTNDGKVVNGQMKFLQAMAIGKYLNSPSMLASIPRGIQRVLINIMGPIARMLGYRALYPKYCGIEK
ncbi:MAG: cupin domain-containing protein [Saprospiraceae bacterium]|nr:cupin domain-containing protein [Saprospiraceae bacterium]